MADLLTRDEYHAIANNTIYGLQATVFCAHGKKALHAFDQYTETKTIWLDLSEHEIDARLE